MHSHQVHNQFPDILNLNFPGILGSGNMVIEIGGDGAVHNGGDSYLMRSKIEHRSLSKTCETEVSRMPAVRANQWAAVGSVTS